jgi:hypothetical protein
MSHVPHLRCNVARLDEEIVGRVWPHLAGPFEVDHRVDNDVGNMDPLWSEFMCNRLGEDPLGGFGWRKTGKTGLAAQRRRVAGGDDHAVTRFDHRRRRPANEMQQGHDVDLEVPLEDGRVDLQEVAEDAANRVMDDDLRVTELVSNAAIASSIALLSLTGSANGSAYPSAFQGGVPSSGVARAFRVSAPGLTAFKGLRLTQTPVSPDLCNLRRSPHPD